MAVEKVAWPFDNAEKIALTATGAQAVEVVDNVTIIDGVTVPATGNRTINVTPGRDLSTGAMLMALLKTAATETTTFGTSITGAVITGVAGKTKTVLFVYDGSGFVQVGDSAQID